MNGSLNRRVSGREMRRHNMAVVSATEAALQALEHNAQMDRARIEALERSVGQTALIRDAGLLGRLKWLVFGR